MDSSQDPNSILQLLQYLQGGGGKGPDTGAPPSGLPPVPSLSGLYNLLGVVSGEPGASTTSGGSQQNNSLSGMQGGLSLQDLQLLQLGETGGDTGTVNASSLLAPIGGTGLDAGSIGQQGGFGTAGQNVAGAGSGPGPAVAGQTAGNTADPFSLALKLLGLAKTGTGVASPFVGQAGNLGTEANVTGSDPAAYAQQREGERQDFTAALPSTVQQTLTELYGPEFAASVGGASPTAVFNSLVSQGLSPNDANEVMKQMLSNPSPDLPANLAGAGAQVGSGFTQSGGGGSLGGFTGTPAGTPNSLSGATGANGGGAGNALGAVGGGIGGTIGVLNLLQAAQNGNVAGGVGGGLQTIGGLASLLKNLPTSTLDSLGLSGLNAAGSGFGNTSVLGDIGAGASGLGGLLGIAGGVQGLVNGTATPGQEVSQLGGGALSAYNALSGLFPDTFTPLSQLASQGGQAFAQEFPQIAQALGIGVGQAAGEAAPSILGGVGTGIASTVGAEAGSGAAGAGAGLAGSAGSLGAGAAGLVAAAPAVAIEVAQMVQAALDNQRAARNLQLRVGNIQGQLPGELAQLGGIPSLYNQLGQTQDPAQVAQLLQQMEDLQTGFQQGGWESYLKEGGTRVSGGTSGDDMTAKLPGVQSILQQYQPFLAENLLGILKGEDILGQAGYTPDQIPGFTGEWNPTSLALNLNAQAYNAANLEPLNAPGSDQPWAGGTLRADLVPSALQFDPATGAGMGGSAPGYSLSPLGLGAVNTDLSNQLAALKPGNLEQSLVNLLQSYGGVNPLYTQFGMLAPNAPGPQSVGPVPQSILDSINQANALYASSLAGNYSAMGGGGF